MRISLLALLLTSLGVASSQIAVAKDKWVCKKEGTEIKLEVKSKDAKVLQKACEEKGGVWEKAAHEASKPSSGAGGAW